MDSPDKARDFRPPLRAILVGGAVLLCLELLGIYLKGGGFRWQPIALGTLAIIGWLRLEKLAQAGVFGGDTPTSSSVRAFWVAVAVTFGVMVGLTLLIFCMPGR